MEMSQKTVEPLKDSWTFVLPYFLHSTQKSETWMIIFSDKILSANNAYKYVTD